MKRLKCYVVLLLVFAMVFSYLPAYAAQTKSVTVHTQKELWAALKDKSVTDITISTTKKITLSINDTGSFGKNLVVKAPNATINNKATFKSINVFVSSQKELDKVLANSDKLKVTTVTVSTKKEVDIKVIAGDYSDIKLVVDAPKATIDTSNANFKTTTVKNVESITTPEPTAAPSKEPTPTATVAPTPSVAPTTTPTTDTGSTGGGYAGGGSSSGGGSYVPSTPVPTVTPTTAPTNTDLEAAKTIAINNVNALVDKYEPYLTFDEFFGLDSNADADGFMYEIKKEVAIIKTYTTVADVNNNSQAFINSVNSVYANNENYKNGTILFRNVITTNRFLCTQPINGYYDFSDTNFDGITRKYYVPVTDTSKVYAIALENTQKDETIVASGSAITYNVKAWNDVDGGNGVEGIYNYKTDANGAVVCDDTNPLNSKDYTVIYNPINGTGSITINPSYTTGLENGYYCLYIKTKVPYLGMHDYQSVVYFKIQ
jgi:hypothetical protein